MWKWRGVEVWQWGSGCRFEGGDMWVRREVREEEGVMSGGVVGRVDGMSKEVMGSVESDWSERIQRCENGIEIERKFSCTVVTCDAREEFFENQVL